MTKLKQIATDLLNWLNGIGSVLLAYALLNPTAATDFLAVLPEKLKTPAALGAPALWFCLVQLAKARSIRSAKTATAPSVVGHQDAQ